MKRITVIFVSLCLVILTASAFAADDAAATYKAKCAMCHGPTGSGDTPVGKSMKIADLKSAPIQAKSDATLAGIISNGLNKMPSFKSQLTQPQIDGLAKYIHTLK